MDQNRSTRVFVSFRFAPNTKSCTLLEFQEMHEHKSDNAARRLDGAARLGTSQEIGQRKSHDTPEIVGEDIPCWDIARLAREARLYDARIVGRSVTSAHDYWLLGRALQRARGNFKRGKWCAWLKQQEIGQDRADRARVLAAAFASAKQIKGLTLEEALAPGQARQAHQTAEACQNAAPTSAYFRGQTGWPRLSTTSAVPALPAAIHEPSGGVCSLPNVTLQPE
jgi:hypothetical protein